MVHPSHQREFRPALRSIGLLGLLLVVFLALPEAWRERRVPDYLAWHMALETLSIAVAALIFGTSWSGRNEHPLRNYSVLGVTFLGVGLLDFAHMLSAEGMPDFLGPGSSDKAIYFWLAARALTACGLLAVAWMQ